MALSCQQCEQWLKICGNYLGNQRRATDLRNTYFISLFFHISRLKLQLPSLRALAYSFFFT